MTIEFSRKGVRQGQEIKGPPLSFSVGPEQDGKAVCTVIAIQAEWVRGCLSVGMSLDFERNEEGFLESTNIFMDPDAGLIRFRISPKQVAELIERRKVIRLI